MSVYNDNVGTAVPLMSTAEVESLLAQVATQVAKFGPPPPPPAVTAKKPFKQAGSSRDGHADLLSPRQLRKVRLHQEEFASDVAARLSVFLRAEVSVKLSALKLASFQGTTESWPEPAHLTLFKTEPLRGVSILEIPPRLGLALVDRLMGGPGQPGDPAHELSAIENALLEQVVQIVIGEWCSHCAHLKELKPVVLGCESSARFLQTSPAPAPMLVVALDLTLGKCQDQIQLAFPFAAIEPLIAQLTREVEFEKQAAPAAAPTPSVRWNAGFDDVPIPVAAEWHGLELAAREVLNLKVGDVLKIDPSSAGRVHLRLGGNTKFHGRLGAVAGKWAVELTEAIKP